MSISELYKTIDSRRIKPTANSYTASLFEQGLDRIIQKVGEEAVEVVVAAKNPGRERVVSEIADLVFHGLVLMNSLGIKPTDIIAELDHRQNNRPKKELL